LSLGRHGRLWYPILAASPEPGRYRHARPDRVACPEQRTEIHSVLRPQRRNYQVITAGIRTSPALALNLLLGVTRTPLTMRDALVRSHRHGA